MDLLREVRRIQPDAARLMITGWSQALSDADLASIDIDALIPKPWDDAELKASLRDALSSASKAAP